MKLHWNIAAVLSVALASADAQQALPGPGQSNARLPNETLPANPQPGIRAIIPDIATFPDELPFEPEKQSDVSLGPSEAAPARQVLPPLDRMPVADFPATLKSVSIDKIHFEGNHVYSKDRLRDVARKFIEISKPVSEQLETVRVALTELYVQHGYVTSGALLPPQDFKNGIIRFKIIEGRRMQVKLPAHSTNPLDQHCDPQAANPSNRGKLPYNFWYRSWWLRNELRRAAGQPVNINDLRGGLQLLRQNTSIKVINAELEPGLNPGDSILDVKSMTVDWPIHFDTVISNNRPPSVGEGSGELRLSDGSVTGHNDPLDVYWGLLRWDKHADLRYDDFDNFGGSYEFPITPWDTTFSVHASKSDSSVIDETFSALGITSRATDFRFSVNQPLYKKLNNLVTVSLSTDREHSKTFLLGEPFSLLPGAINGTSDVFAIRFAFEVINRSQYHALTLRSTFSLGLHAFGSTRAEDGIDSTTISQANNPSGSDTQVPDSEFFHWRGQAQYAWHLFDSEPSAEKAESPNWKLLRETTLILRANAQFSNRALLSLEQFSIGGMDSVRGYRENQLIRDDGVFVSAEARFPVRLTKDKTPLVAVAPFFDWGSGWNVSKSDARHQSIYSTGVGLLVNATSHAHITVYWGHPLVDLHQQKSSLQDYGIHLVFSVNAID